MHTHSHTTTPYFCPEEAGRPLLSRVQSSIWREAMIISLRDGTTRTHTTALKLNCCFFVVFFYHSLSDTHHHSLSSTIWVVGPTRAALLCQWPITVQCFCLYKQKCLIHKMSHNISFWKSGPHFSSLTFRPLTVNATGRCKQLLTNCSVMEWTRYFGLAKFQFAVEIHQS